MSEDYPAEDVPMEEAPEDLLEEDEIDDREEAFLKGYDDVDEKADGDDIKDEDTTSSE